VEALEDRNLMSFSSIVSYPAGLNPYAIVTADFNNDARPDIAVANVGDNTVSVLLGNADGTFQAPLNAATGTGPRSLAVGDFDHDGNLDIATANAGDVSVLLGKGDGTFKPAQNTSIGSNPLSVAVGDFNHDGKLDLGATSFTSQAHTGYYCGYFGCYPFTYYTYTGYANVLIGDGSGSFASPMTTQLNGGFAYASWAGDLNGDGRADLIAAVSDISTVSVLLANEDGSLQAPHDFATAYYPRSLAVGDLNGDGKVDVATANSSSVSALMGDGAGGFGTAQTTYLGTSPLSVAMGDLNADGTLDLAVTSNVFVIDSCPYYCYGHYEGRVDVLLGYGDGTFADVNSTTLPGIYPYGVTLGDFNGDTIPDIATANNDTNNVTVLLNAGDWILPPKISINDVTVTEGDSGTVDATFTVSLSFASTTHTVTVDYTTSSGTATDGQDYVGVTSPQTLTFTPGNTIQHITIQVKGDLIDEYDEYFYVYLSNPTIGLITDGQGVGTILDNDPPPTLSINDVSITEGKRGTKLLTFTVTLTGQTEKWVSVNYATADGTAKTSDHDYQATSGTLWFSPGQTTATISVVIYGDSKKEPNETFSVNLSGPSEATILDGIGIGTILNDDGGGRGNSQH
jgi:hypothetical protein